MIADVGQDTWEKTLIGTVIKPRKFIIYLSIKRVTHELASLKYRMISKNIRNTLANILMARSEGITFFCSIIQKTEVSQQGMIQSERTKCIL